jgi:drug/metabolite transporter (DMT)-like permease
MIPLSPPILVAIGIFTTAFAQILLKKASLFEIRTGPWLALMGTSACFYVVSFFLYSQMLRFYPINKVYPATTVAQIILITAAGLMMGEVIDIRHALGLALGALSIYLILS